MLVLRKDRVEHEHFRAPSAFPVLGAIVCLYLVTQDEAAIYLRAGILLAVGPAFWALNHFMSGRADELEAEQLHG